MLQTERSFTLPFGYVDQQGQLHRQGIMRLATARDQVDPLADSRVRANEAWLSILLLSRVVVQLGSIRPVTPDTIAGLFAADFAFLQDLYLNMNDDSTHIVQTQCPQCTMRFAIDLMSEAEQPRA